MWAAFQTEYLPVDPPAQVVAHELSTSAGGDVTRITAQLVVDGEHVTVSGDGTGPIDAFVHALRDGLGASLDVVDYAEHAIGAGADAAAVAYVETVDETGTPRWGVGTDQNILTASLRAVLCAHERHRQGA